MGWMLYSHAAVLHTMPPMLTQTSLTTDRFLLYLISVMEAGGSRLLFSHVHARGSTTDIVDLSHANCNQLAMQLKGRCGDPAAQCAMDVLGLLLECW